MAPPPTRVRVYVGGLPADTNEKELQDRFARFATTDKCKLQSVELLAPKGLFALNTDTKHRGFAYLTLEGDAANEIVEKLVKTYHKTKWRGSVLRVEPAKPDYLVRLQQEWQEQREREERQKVIMAEARGLVTPSSGVADDEELEINVGVEFQGKKRTTFAYDDLDLEAAFAPKKVVQPQTNGYHTEQSGDEEEAELPHTETESGDDDDEQDEGSEQDSEDEDEKQNDDGDNGSDADYWASSGDEGEEQVAKVALVAKAPAPAVEAPVLQSRVQDAVAVDDVEAFVLQMEQEEAEAQRHVAAAVDAKKTATAATGSAALAADDVEAYVQQVEREEANARRIAALEAKMKQKQQQATVGKIDLSAKSNKKITFDDSGNEEEEGTHDDDRDENEATGGSGAITNWLDSSDDEGDDNKDYGELQDGSDNEDDLKKKEKKRKDLGAFDFVGDGDDDNEDAKAFAVRPEFLGERGKKLFELQKRFGGDQRFRMDARFIEDEENEYGGNDDLVLGDDALAAMAEGPAGELQQFQEEDGEDLAAVHEREFLEEQDLALSVIAELFPDVDIENIKYRLRVKVKKDPIKEASWMGQMKRYDPRDLHSRHAFEIPIEDKKAKKTQQQIAGDGNESDAGREAKTRREEKEVLIGGDRFFSTSNNLGSMFTRVRKNSEDGMEGEAALDGVFGFSRGFGDAGTESSAAAANGESGATFKLSSLFDFPVEGEKEKNSRLAAMGEKLFEDDDDAVAADEDDKPWHFTQSFFSEEKDDVQMDTDHEEEGDDDENDGEEDEVDDERDGKKKKVLKKSLAEFLAFGKTFLCPQDGSTSLKSKEWTEKRKKLTLDFKRKRKDALRNKKKIQQRLQKQHKKQKTTR